MEGNAWWMRRSTLGLLGIAVIFLTFVAVFPVSPGDGIRNSTPAGQTVQDSSRKTIHIGGREVTVTVADTPDSRERGLSGRNGLAPDEGMLFVFPSDARYGFWMKDMRFPIDILWLSSRSEVIEIRQRVSPLSYPAVFTPRAPARYVLELPAGFVEAYNVKIGDSMSTE